MKHILLRLIGSTFRFKWASNFWNDETNIKVVNSKQAKVINLVLNFNSADGQHVH